jgi:translation initiation factor IF-2
MPGRGVEGRRMEGRSMTGRGMPGRSMTGRRVHAPTHSPPPPFTPPLASPPPSPACPPHLHGVEPQGRPRAVGEEDHPAVAPGLAVGPCPWAQDPPAGPVPGRPPDPDRAPDVEGVPPALHHVRPVRRHHRRPPQPRPAAAAPRPGPRGRGGRPRPRGGLEGGGGRGAGRGGAGRGGGGGGRVGAGPLGEGIAAVARVVGPCVRRGLVRPRGAERLREPRRRLARPPGAVAAVVGPPGGGGVRGGGIAEGRRARGREGWARCRAAGRCGARGGGNRVIPRRRAGRSGRRRGGLRGRSSSAWRIRAVARHSARSAGLARCSAAARKGRDQLRRIQIHIGGVVAIANCRAGASGACFDGAVLARVALVIDQFPYSSLQKRRGESVIKSVVQVTLNE